MLYALNLWICADRLTGTLIVGQLASVTLVLWFGAQTLRLRRAKTPILLQTPATSESWQGFREEVLDLLRSIASQSFLGRLFPSLNTSSSDSKASSSKEGAIRAAAIREVGYEFVDDVIAQGSAPKSKDISDAKDSWSSPKTAKTGHKSFKGVSRENPSGKQSEGAEKAQKKRKFDRFTVVFQKAVIIKDWSIEIIQSISRRRKTPRPVIDIPPRPSKDSAAAEKPRKSSEEISSFGIEKSQATADYTSQKSTDDQGESNTEPAPDLADETVDVDAEKPAESESNEGMFEK